MIDHDDTASLPLRARKKALTRQTIIDAAEQLFEARGYDNVTVAEIADAANVSVKTLFVYFRSKEDLALADSSLVDAVVEAVTHPHAGESPAQSVGRALRDAITNEPGGGVADYHRAYGDAHAVQNRLLRVWAELEDQLTEALAARRAHEAEPADRYDAIKLAGIVRLTASTETLRHASTPEKLRAAVAAAVAAAAVGP